MMKKYFLFGLFLFFTFPFYIYAQTNPSGELIDGPANVRDTVNGKILFTLNDSVQIYTLTPENNWYQVGATVQLTNEQAENEEIPSGVKLFDKNNKEIGITKNKIKPWLVDDYKGLHLGIISGYTYKNNIRAKSLIESILTDSINRYKDYSLKTFKGFIKKYNFIYMPYFQGFDCYYVFKNTVNDISPGPRIFLFFQNDTLEAIVSSRQMHINNMRKVNLARNYKGLFFETFKDKNKFIEKFNPFVLAAD